METILSRVDRVLAKLLSCREPGANGSGSSNTLIRSLEIFRQFCRESDNNKQQVLLDQLHKQLVALKELPQCTSQLEAFHTICDGVCCLYFKHVGQNRNVAKRAVKVLKVLHRLDKSTIATRLTEEWNPLLEDVWSVCDLQKVFQLLDEPVLVREYIQDLWRQLLLTLAGTWQKLHLEISSSTAPILMMDRCYLATKISLQLFQALASGDVLAGPVPVLKQVCEVGGDSPAVHTIGSTLLEVIFSQVCSLDCKLFASNALGFLLNMSNSPKDGAETADNLIRLPEKEGHQTVITGDLWFKVTVPSLSTTEQSWCQVVLVRGLLTCVRLDILLQQVQDAQMHQQEQKICLFFDVLLPLVTKFCGDVGVGDIQFHAFYALEQWLKRVRTDLSHIHASSGRHFHPDGLVTITVLQCLWNNWENPIVGVPDLVRSSFGLLLALHQEENTLTGQACSMLFEDLFVKLAGTSWHVKGRYILLVELIPYVQVLQVLSSHKNIPTQLVQALSTNHIAPASSDVYRAFLVAIREKCGKDEKAAADVWSNFWLETFLSAICNKNHLIRHNAMQHWVPCTLRLFPGVFPVISTQLQDRPGLASGTIRLRAHMAVLKAARTLNIVATHDMANDAVREALWHGEEDVRAEAFAIICSHPKKSDPLSSAELGLLQEFLPLNMNSDAAAFRQVICNNMRKLMVRLRDGSWTLLKKFLKSKAITTPSTIEAKTHLMQIIGFVDWLVDLCVMSTFPGACYQRRKTALELLWIIYDHLTADWGNEPKTSANYQTLLEWTMAQSSWDFFSERNAAALLNCLEDGSAEVRELAYHLLLAYFPTPWCWWGLGEGETGDRLFTHARQLLHSPKAQECEAGALLIKLIFNKLCTQRGLDFCGETVSHPGSAPIRFIRGLLCLLQDQHQTATSNLLQAARQAPMHGVLLALRQCLSSPALWVQHKSQDAVQLKLEVNDLVTGVEAVLSLVLRALAGVKGEEEDQEVSPSFADMGEAISSIICEGGNQGEGEDDIALTPEHELVLACCWLNIKEAGLLLGQLVDSVLQRDCDLMTPEEVQSIGRMFVRILTQCRHRGAIESCNIGFLMVCKRLLSHSDANMAAIPAQILDQVLDVISGNRSTSNITRRSAGLPLLVQAITASEPRGNYRPLLGRAVQTLLTTARLPLARDEDQTVDIPQVHALNVLRALFSDSTLGAAMLAHISDAVMLAISGFSSPVWAIRNAAMQLYGTLLIRMLGPKRVRDEHSAENTITAREFFTRWPSLRLFLLQQLEEAVGRQGEGRLYLHPGLQPVLILLSKLGPGIEDEEHRKLLSQFVLPVMAQASSPLLSVRVLCARALVPLVSVEAQASVMCSILQQVPPTPGQQVVQNNLHGAILQVMHLLQQWRDSTRKNSLQESRDILQAVLARSWVATSSNTCPATRADYLNLLLASAQSCNNCPERERVLSVLKDEVSRVRSNVELSCQPVASELLLKTAASVSLQLLTLSSASIETQEQLTRSLLASPCVDVRRATFLHIQDMTSRDDLTELLWILPILQQQLEEETDLLCLELCLDSCVVFHTTKQQLQHSTTLPTSLWAVIMQFAQGQKGTSICAKALPVLAIILREMLQSDTCREELQQWSQLMETYSHPLQPEPVREELQQWSQLMETYSHPLQPEPVRIGVGRALQQVGGVVMEKMAVGHQEEGMEVVLRLTRATLALLQDEVREPRTQATQFAALLPRIASIVQYPDIHTTAALRVLLAYLVDRFWWSSTLWKYFLHTLYPDDPVSTISQHACTGSTHLFEQEEVNVYAEGLTLAQLIKDSFRNLVNKQCAEKKTPVCNTNYLMAAIEEAREKLSLLVLTVEKGRHEGLLGVTGYGKPLSVLYSFLLYVDCLIYQLQNLHHSLLPTGNTMVDEKIEDIKCSLLQLQKVPALHPILQSVLNPTCLYSQQQDLHVAANKSIQQRE